MIYSSVNLDRFITAPQVLGVIISKSRWLENIRTGQIGVAWFFDAGITTKQQEREQGMGSVRAVTDLDWTGGV